MHLIGKDILTTHGVYWPTMLHALGLPQPKTIFAHGWWIMDGAKMSKSLGNVVKPLDLADVYGVDAFRYFLMRDMTLGRDADFSRDADRPPLPGRPGQRPGQPAAPPGEHDRALLRGTDSRAGGRRRTRKRRLREPLPGAVVRGVRRSRRVGAERGAGARDGHRRRDQPLPGAHRAVAGGQGRDEAGWRRSSTPPPRRCAWSRCCCSRCCPSGWPSCGGAWDGSRRRTSGKRCLGVGCSRGRPWSSGQPLFPKEVGS